MDKIIFLEVLEKAKKKTNGKILVVLSTPDHKKESIYTGNVISTGESSFYMVDKYKHDFGFDYDKVKSIRPYVEPIGAK